MGILNTLDTAILLICLTGTIGCGKQSPTLPTGGVGNAPAAAPKALPGLAQATPAETNDPVSTPPVTVSITYYSLTKRVVQASGGGSSYELFGTGSCTLLDSKTICWDDGQKFLPPNFGPGGYQYWGMVSGTQLCYVTGAPDCTTDYFSTPKEMTTAIKSVLYQKHEYTSYRTSAEVFASGTEQTASCTDDGAGTYDCGTFVLDTNL